MSDNGWLSPRMQERFRDFVRREIQEFTGLHPSLTEPTPAKGPEAKPGVAEKKPAVTPQTSINVNIVTEKYAVTVEAKGGQEYATAKTGDGKEICKDLPQAKWNTLPADVRSILNGVQVQVNGRTEQIKVET